MKRALAVSALVAIAVGGCGGNGVSEDDYERELMQVSETLEQSFGRVGTNLAEAGNARRAVRDLEEAAAALEVRARELGDVDPPSKIEDQHDELVAGLTALAAEFRRGADLAREGDLDPLLQFTAGLQESDAFRRLTQASEAIAAEGYRPEPPN